mgnify:CR=1 FL=1|jgi:hypothetical protein
MFQIFDCLNNPVGREAGYLKHSTAQGLVERPGRIRRAIYDTFARVRGENPLQCHVYSIRWVDPVAVTIINRTGIPSDRLIVAHVGGAA